MNKPYYNPAEMAVVVQLNAAAEDHWRRVRAAKRAGKEDSEAERALVALVPPGLYEHFKSTNENQKFYVVSGLGPEVNGNVHPTVAYMALYQPHAGEPVSRVLFSPRKDAFYGPIERPNDPVRPYTGKRFHLIRKLTHTEQGILKDHAKRLARCKTRASFFKAIEKLLD